MCISSCKLIISLLPLKSLRRSNLSPLFAFSMPSPSSNPASFGDRGYGVEALISPASDTSQRMRFVAISRLRRCAARRFHPSSTRLEVFPRQFHKEKRSAYLSKPATKALERTRRSTAAAREKHRIYQQQYRTRPEVKEKERERDRKYLALPETKAKRCELSRKWRLKAGSPDKIRAWGLRWRTNNPEKIRARNERRRALKMNAKGIGIPFDEQAQLRRQKFRCYYCDCKLDKYHIDHIVPLSRGGTEYPDNKVLACPQCNLRKHDKMPHEWVDGGRLL